MIKISKKFPNFSLTGVISNNINKAFIKVDEKSYLNKWLVIFFWPKDFTLRFHFCLLY
ncbi:redoxin domain-containing protein [Candidatus Coxiella mudrowiae]|uniref:redoxin domain-containing protein n=1 Tax=Candidatus Coxiella mudrowiae TaxID=2054173 RepID=UPI0024681BFE|nr:redoxin domain-containing protein [Candidatus Coxiella mudrowiae]